MPDIFPDMAAKRAEITPRAEAFREHASGRAWTFAEVDRAASAIGAGLLRRGLREGDRLAVLTLNRVEFFLLLFACQKTGAILCPANWRQPAAELAEVLATVAPSAILADAPHRETAETVAGTLGLPALPLEESIAGWIEAGGSLEPRPVPAERPWYLLFTSGTTGLPKAVIQTARMAWANTVNISQAVDLVSSDRSVNFLPLFHTAGINLYTLPLFLSGGASTVLPRFEAEALAGLIEDGAITQVFGVPAIYQALSQLACVDRIDWSRVRLGCGGAPLPEPLIRFFAERGAMVLNGFGMTETGPTVFLMDPAGAAEKIGSVGRAQMLTEVRLDGVPEGEPGEGEVLFRGPNVTPGYWGNEAATRGAFTGDGWLRSGDVGRRDAEGYYYVVDRLKDMYISGGENVYPAEVERMLHCHPQVQEAAVVGVADNRWGEVGAAFLVARPGAAIDCEGLAHWCRERLAAYKVPARFRIVDDLPRTAAGKVRKAELQDWAR